MKNEIIGSIVVAIAITLLGCLVCSTKVSTHVMLQWATMMWITTFVAALITSTIIDDYKGGYASGDSWCFVILSWLLPVCMFSLLLI